MKRTIAKCLCTLLLLLLLFSLLAPSSFAKTKDALIESVSYDAPEGILGEGTAASSADSFWCFYALIGFLLPLGVLIPSLLLPRSKTRGCPRYWYTLAVLAGGLLLIALLMLLLLVV